MTGALCTVRRNAVMIPVALIIMDRLITVTYWSYESNPLVSDMGTVKWVALTVGLIIPLVWLWYDDRIYESVVSRACVYCLSVLMATVVATNGLYVTGLWPF